MGVGQEPGIIISKVALDSTKRDSVIGFPTGVYPYGCLITIVTEKNTTATELYKNAQIYIPHYDGSTSSSEYFAIRTFRDGVLNLSIPRQWKLVKPDRFTTAQIVS